VVETLTKQGVEVYFIDWIPPARTDNWRGFDAYVNGDIARAVRAVQTREGVEQVSLLGYCLGGLLTALYCALHPQTVKNLVTFTLPLDMSVREIPFYSLMDKLSPQTIDLITATYGNCPAWLIKAGFDAMAPLHHALDKYVDCYRNKDREGQAEMFNLFEKWMNSDVPLAGQLFRELSRDIFQQNLLVRGRLQVGGRTVNLKHITCPVLNVIGERDDVVHPKSSLPFIELVGSSEARNLVFPTGHIGAAVSTSAQKKLWPQVGAWLRDAAN
jgi:polyhydroxyalkanoate synthase